jgi:hypothetical protein
MSRMNRVPLLLGLTLAVFILSACDDECAPCRPGTRPSQPEDQCSACIPVGDEDANPIDARWDGPPCSSSARPDAGYPFFCVAGSPGGICNDAGEPPVCTNGRWVCAAALTTPANLCACFAPGRPGCSCSSTGWVCQPDGGADGSAVF